MVMMRHHNAMVQYWIAEFRGRTSLEDRATVEMPICSCL